MPEIEGIGASSGGPPPIPHGPHAVGSFSANTSDPWAKMLGPTATPEQVKQFKEAVIRALNSQMAQERAHMTRALRRMRKEEE